MDTSFSVIDSILQAALVQSTFEWLALIFSIIYVVLAAKENIWCWGFGLIGTFFSLLVYFKVQLYSDMTLQIFYIIMSIYGFISWKKGRSVAITNDILDSSFDDKGELAITTLSVEKHVGLIIGGCLLAFVLGYLWSFAGAALPYIDGLTTSFSIIATFMVTRKILENWIYWIVIDFACIFIYINREIYLFSFLFLVYCIIAIFGYFNWQQQLSKSKFSEKTA